MRERELLDLALRIADGSDVDWDGEESAASPDERRALRSLRLISLIASRTRSEGATADGPASGYEILDLLGAGANGEVHRARDRALGRLVAVKRLRAGEAAPPGGDPAGRTTPARATPELLLEEARRLARVKHPNVVTVHSADLLEGRPVVVMELVEGRTLGEIVRVDGRRGPDEIVAIARALCGALSAVHAAGLLHLDVKPGNVMREEGGRIVLMDFGPGAATPMFTAPELLRGETPDARADVFSLGVLLFHLATGEYPFRAHTVEELERAHREGRSTALRDARPDLPAFLTDAIDRAMAPDPADRPASPGGLERLLAPPGKSSSSRRGPALLAAGTVAVLAIAVAVAVPLLRRTPAGEPRLETAARFTVSASLRGGADRAVTLTEGSPVSVGDSLSLTIRASERTWVYVVDEDDAGEAYLLFPLPGMDRGNPLPPGVDNVLPGTRDGAPFFWQMTSRGGREHVVVVASARRLEGLEQDLLALPHSSPDRLPAPRALSEEARRKLRGLGGLVGAPPAGGPGVPRSLFESARPLGDGPETADGIWIRRVTLVAR